MVLIGRSKKLIEDQLSEEEKQELIEAAKKNLAEREELKRKIRDGEFLSQAQTNKKIQIFDDFMMETQGYTQEEIYALHAVFPVSRTRTFGYPKLRDTSRGLVPRGESRNGSRKEAIHGSSSARDPAQDA